MIPYTKRQKIVAQALSEIEFAREYKQGKVRNWKINEDLYYGRKIQSPDARANVDLGKAGAFVHTILSKIDAPLIFKFEKAKEAQLKRIRMLNALKAQDQERDNWDIKDIVGKKQGIIYGRAIYSYFADSYNGYCPHLNNVDVYDFLIDPSAGGIDIERAAFLGDYGVVKTRQEIEKGAKDGIYLKTESKELLEGTGNADESNQEETNKMQRSMDVGVWKTSKEMSSPDKFKFWQWGTTFEGDRYYLLLSNDHGTAIEIVPIEEKFESKLWWYWTWAVFPDLTEFWTPSYLDYVREIFMAQAVSINQMLDNGEQLTKPQKIVDVSAIENLAELKYRRDGVIKAKKGVDVNKALQLVLPTPITTPINVYNTLETIQEKASGVTAAAQGASPNNSTTKATIYKGNEENSADRFGLLNKSYAFGYKRFAELYDFGVREHLIKKVAVEILGANGVEIFEVSRRDIYRKGDKFKIKVESSNAELALSEAEKTTKAAFLKSNQGVMANGKPLQNPQKAYEMQAGIVGFNEEEIRQLQDTSDYGTAGLMSEAERDIERIMDGEKIEANEAANTAYKQRFHDYMRQNKENISPEQFRALAEYVFSLDAIITRNMVAQANAEALKMAMAEINQPPVPVDPAQAGALGGVTDIAPADPMQQNQPIM